MRHVKLVLMTAVVAALAAPAFAQTCTGVTVSSPEEPEAAGVYHATVTGDLQVAVSFDQELTGDHLLELRYVQPSGRLYQEVAVPVGDPSLRESGASHRKVEGYPYPLEVRYPEAGRGGPEPQVVTAFPVGGTHIQTSGLYGGWSVEAAVDGTPCASTAFELAAAPAVEESGAIFSDGFESGDDGAWSVAAR
jgi:hypothetical protein